MKEYIKQEIEGIGIKVCTQCNKEKLMTAFSTQGNWRARKATCKECLAVGEIYKAKRPPMKLEEGKKECGKCYEMKPLNEYFERKDGRGGRRPYCKICEGKARNPEYQPIDKDVLEAKRKAKAELKEMNSKKRAKQEEERLQRKMLTEPRKEAIRMFNEWKKNHASEEWKKGWKKGLRQREWMRGAKEKAKAWRKNNPEKARAIMKAVNLRKEKRTPT